MIVKITRFGEAKHKNSFFSPTSTRFVFNLSCKVGGAGFEPAKVAQQIYSLPRLTASVPHHVAPETARSGPLVRLLLPRTKRGKEPPPERWSGCFATEPKKVTGPSHSVKGRKCPVCGGFQGVKTAHLGLCSKGSSTL